MNDVPIKHDLHPRNRFRTGYDFAALTACLPELAAFVRPNTHGNASIDYSDPRAVKTLNQALLRDVYGLHDWDIPAGALCPPIPGRSDHVHHLADLLATSHATSDVPRGRSVAVLDIGTGASCIYPLIGASEYGWRFVGSDVEPEALRWARKLVARHPQVSDLIECREQSEKNRCFEGVVQPGERFDLSICNPPFYRSANEAAERNETKRRNLAKGKAVSRRRNFGGSARELWCDGGELGFVQRMIAQSAERPTLCTWFTTLIASGAHLSRLQSDLRQVGAVDIRILEMAQGRKQSRILAWRLR